MCVGKKYNVTYVPEEQILAKINSSELGTLKHPDAQFAAFDLEKFLHQWLLECLRDNHVGFEGKNLNELCPEVRPMGVAEFLRTWWGQK